MRPSSLRFSASCLVLTGLLALGLAACDSNEPIVDRLTLLDQAESEAGRWVWLDVPGATCRDGSATGLGVRLQEDSDDLVIFMEGGGACFNPFTCSQNRASFSEADFFSDDFIGDGGFGNAGLFDADTAANPVAGWNVVYVPYCTGDVHSGSNPSGVVPGVDADGDEQDDVQRFVGYDNFARYVEALEAYFEDDLDEILVTGASAGGVGTLANFEQVADAFDDARLTLLNDSGPLVKVDSVLAPALQQIWIGLWNLFETYPGDPISPDQPEAIENIYGYYAEAYPNASLGLASYEQDFTIRYFYSFGVALEDSTCAQRLYGGLQQDPPQRVSCISGPAYERALYDLRASVPEDWATFYADGEAHTFLRSQERYYTTTAGGQTFAAWLGSLLDGTAEDLGTQDAGEEDGGED